MSDSETGMSNDLHEALVMARMQGKLAPVRVLRILAGEGHGQFRSGDSHNTSVPLSVAMDYISATLDDTNRKMQRLQVRSFFNIASVLNFPNSAMLQNNVEEYSRLCSEIEMEIDALMSSGRSKPNILLALSSCSSVRTISRSPLSE